MQIGQEIRILTLKDWTSYRILKTFEIFKKLDPQPLMVITYCYITCLMIKLTTRLFYSRELWGLK